MGLKKRLAGLTMALVVGTFAFAGCSGGGDSTGSSSAAISGEINAYKERLVNYVQITKSCVHLCIDVRNNGTAKACNVSATIEFPDGVEVYDRDILQLEEPKPPSVGKNPIELAKKRRRDPFGLAVDRSYADFQIAKGVSGGQYLQNLIASQNANYKCFNHTLEIHRWYPLFPS